MFTLHQGDALRILSQLSDESIDGVITDPPYNSGGQLRKNKKSTSQLYLNKASTEVYPDFMGENKDNRSFKYWMTIWLSECFRVQKNNTPICIFSDFRQLPTISDALQSAGYYWDGVFVWNKVNSRPVKGRFRQVTEFVLWGSKGGFKRDRDVGYLPGISSCNPQTSERYHQTTKPIALMNDIVKIVEAGGTILDPFSGSGSTGVAAINQGYKFIGIEQSKEYALIAEQRLKAA